MVTVTMQKKIKKNPKGAGVVAPMASPMYRVPQSSNIADIIVGSNIADVIVGGAGWP